MGREHSVLVIAEIGVNHNGSTESALRLINVAAECGADAVKFQTFSAEKLVAGGTKTAAYQQQQTGEQDQLALLKRLELPVEAYPALVARCRDRAVEFMSTPFDAEAADMLVGYGMRRIKVPSGEITNLPLLAHLAKMRLPLIVSTGMSTLDEVREAVEQVHAVWREIGLNHQAPGMLTLLHCTSNYPAAAQDVNLTAMQTMQREFGLAVGYSDHTLGTAVSVAAVALGASVIEKHLTLDCALPGPDHQASLEPHVFRELVQMIRQVEACRGNGEKRPSPGELPVRQLVRRSVTVRRPLKAGQIIGADDVTLLRPGTGIAPKELGKVIGMRARTDLSVGATLNWSDLVS